MTKVVTAKISWFDCVSTPTPMVEAMIENKLRDAGFKIKGRRPVIFSKDLDKRIEPPYCWWDEDTARIISQKQED